MTSRVPTLPSQVNEQRARREFLKQVGKGVVTAPAIALLLAASSKPASALADPSCPPPDQLGDPDDCIIAGDASGPDFE